MNQHHKPVLLDEMLDVISPKSGETYIDGTFGAGGYSSAILKSSNCIVYGIDRDNFVKKHAEALYNKFPDRFKLYIEKFSNIGKIVENKKVNGIVLDLGVSSMQLEEPSRGFSFMKDGPLDMRMSSSEKIDARILINAFHEEEIARIIYKYSNERHSKKIAAAIVRYRNKKLITSTAELAQIITSVVPRKKNDKINPATRTFQAIRIWVNDELGELEKGIDEAIKTLDKDGRFAIVSFHSLEDKIVKDKFNNLCGKEEPISRHHPWSKKNTASSHFALINKKVIKPTALEINLNPRSRSGRLRAIKKIV